MIERKDETEDLLDSVRRELEADIHRVNRTTIHPDRGPDGGGEIEVIYPEIGHPYSITAWADQRGYDDSYNYDVEVTQVGEKFAGATRWVVLVTPSQ